MASTKVIKPKSVEAPRKAPERLRPERLRPGRLAVATGPRAELTVPPVRKSRASSCPRCPQRERPGRSRSCSSAPRAAETGSRTDPDHRRTLRAAPGDQKPREVKREQRAEATSHKAFTVIPPNPKKRREMQRKAEAELNALEELRLSRAMTYVSINPSSVGGCMSLEEVRLKQQQEMMQAKRKPV